MVIRMQHEKTRAMFCMLYVRTSIEPAPNIAQGARQEIFWKIPNLPIQKVVPVVTPKGQVSSWDGGFWVQRGSKSMHPEQRSDVCNFGGEGKKDNGIVLPAETERESF